MATTLSHLIVKLDAQTSGLSRGMKDAQRATDGFAGRVRSLDKDIFNLRNAMIALGAVTGAALVGRKILEIGAAVEETASKYRTVFGPATEQTNRLLGDQARLLGLTDTEMRDVLATTGAIAQGMGFAQQESARFASEITTLAGDLASFNNIPIEETSRAIQAALTGERESLKRLGVVILETDVQLRALANTGKAAATALTQQEKATATLQLITERAGVAVGDLERTQDSAANRARAFGARMRELRDTLSSALVPAIMEVVNALDVSAGRFEGLSEAVAANQNRIAAWTRFTIEAVKFVGSVLGNLVQIAYNVGQAIGHALMTAIEQFVGTVMATLNMPAQAANLLIEQLNRIPGVDIDFRIGTLDAQAWFDGARERADLLTDAVGNIGDAIGDVATAWSRMAEAAGEAKTTQVNAIESVAAALDSLLQPVIAPTPATGGAKKAARFGGGPDVAPWIAALLRTQDDLARFGYELGVRAEQLRDQFTHLGQTGQAAMQMVGSAALDLAGKFSPLGIVALLIEGAMEGLRPAIEALEAPFRILGQFLGGLLAPLLKVVATAFSYVVEAIGWFIEALGKFIDKIVPDWISKAGKGLAEFGQEMQENARAARRGTEATDEAARAAERLSAGLTNAVRGFKTAAYAHGATAVSTATTPTDKGPGARPGPVTIPVSFGDIIVQGGYRELYEELDQRTRGGGEAARAWFRSFPEPAY